MRTEEFLTDVGKRFEMTDVMLGDLGDYARKLIPSSREKLAKALRERLSYSKINTLGSVIKIAKEIGVKKQSDNLSYYYCEDCQIRFNTASRGCPLCGKPLYQMKYHAGIVGKEEVGDITQLREDCWECIHYDKSKKECEGPTCPVWGKWHNDSSACQTCVCKQCCKEKFLFENNFKEFHRLDLDGKLEDRTAGRKRA